jgi:uncharacterized phage protein gp47/JayE
LVTEVQDYIAPDGPNGGGKAPIGADVTVEGATAVDVDVEADLTIDGAYVEADVQTAIEEAIAAYFQSLTFADDNDVRHARVVTAILDVPGVIDATGVTINGAGANIVIAQKEIATLGATTWT